MLAVVTLGLGMAKQGKYTINPHAVEKVETIVAGVAHISEAAIFMLAGVVAGRALSVDGMMDRSV